MNTHQNSHTIDTVKITGNFINFTKPDLNGRIYPQEFMLKDIKEYMLKILRTERKEKLKKLKNI